MKDIIVDAKQKLKFFKKGKSKPLEVLRKGDKTRGFLSYEENLIVPQISKYNFIRDKKSLRIETSYGLLEYEVFNFLMSKVIYDGNVKRWSKIIKDVMIIGGKLNSCIVLHTNFGNTDDVETVKFSECLFDAVTFKHCKFLNVNFMLSIFTKCTFFNCTFLDCNFEGTQWGGTKESLEKGKYKKNLNKVNLCFSKNCAISTAIGIGSAPFFEDKINSGLAVYDKIWYGSVVYESSQEKINLIESKKEINEDLLEEDDL